MPPAPAPMTLAAWDTPEDSDSVANAKTFDLLADLQNRSSAFVAQSYIRAERAVLVQVKVGAADATCRHFNESLIGSHLRLGRFFDCQFVSILQDYGFHGKTP
jgi:hypothetical protein